jgi:hypothetical protein
MISKRVAILEKDLENKQKLISSYHYLISELISDLSSCVESEKSGNAGISKMEYIIQRLKNIRYGYE